MFTSFFFTKRILNKSHQQDPTITSPCSLLPYPSGGQPTSRKCSILSQGPFRNPWIQRWTKSSVPPFPPEKTGHQHLNNDFPEVVSGKSMQIHESSGNLDGWMLFFIDGWTLFWREKKTWDHVAHILNWKTPKKTFKPHVTLLSWPRGQKPY